jgi:hypothetical protein
VRRVLPKGARGGAGETRSVRAAQPRGNPPSQMPLPFRRAEPKRGIS